MDFDLSAKREAWITVRFNAVLSEGDEDGEQVEKQVRLKVDFVDKTEFSELLVGPGEDADEAEKLAFATRDDVDIVKRLVIGWAVKDKGQPAPFTDDNLRRLLEWPNFSAAFITEYAKAWGGQVEVREKNSDGSPANGSAATTGSARTTPSQRKPRSSASTRR